MVLGEGERETQRQRLTHKHTHTGAAHPLVMEALDTVVRVARNPLVCRRTRTPIRTNETSCGSIFNIPKKITRKSEWPPRTSDDLI